jgi:hypothetical protein
VNLHVCAKLLVIYQIIELQKMATRNGGKEEIRNPTLEEWSEWLDFNRETITSIVPQESGLFKVHASMKILHIGTAQNLRTTLLDFTLDSCVGKGQRFSFMINRGSLENLKRNLLIEYKLRHNGKLPACMESAGSTTT